MSPQDRFVLREAESAPFPTVGELCRLMGVTATAVRQRLLRLQEQGLIERSAVRRPRGRPSYVYQTTPAGRRQIGSNYAELAAALWRALKSVPGDSVRREVWAHVRNQMVSDYLCGTDASRNAPVAERIQHLRGVLAGRGFEMDEEPGVLRERSCPYHELAHDDPSVCDLEQSVFESILGTRLSRTRWCLAGDSCCEFRPIAEDFPKGPDLMVPLPVVSRN